MLKLRFYTAALAWTEQAMIRLSEPSLRNDGTVPQLQNELQYRYQRLKRRIKEKEQHGIHVNGQSEPGVQPAEERTEG